MKAGQYQFLFKKGSEWRGYNKNFGVVLPDGALLTQLRRTVFGNIVLINARSYTKPVDQKFYEVYGDILETSLPSDEEIESLFTNLDICRMKIGNNSLYVYETFCVMFDGEDRFVFCTHTMDKALGLSIKYDGSDTDNIPFQDFLQVLLNTADDYDTSTLSSPIIPTIRDTENEEANTQLNE